MEIREAELKRKFKQIIQLKGFKILREITNAPSDLILEKNGRKFGVELKASEDCIFSQALGQLLIAKIKFNFDKMWLVLDFIPSINKSDELEVFRRHKISIFSVVDGKLIKISKRNLRPLIRQSQLEVCRRISEIVEMFPDGITFNEIGKILELKPNAVRFFVKGFMRKAKSCGGWLREKVIIEGNILKPVAQETKGISEDTISSIKRTLSSRTNYLGNTS